MFAIVAALAMHWLVLNDIHLNPYAAAVHQRYGVDTTPALFDDAVREMQRADPDPPVIVLGGDFLAHHFRVLAAARRRDPYREGIATIGAIAHRLGRAFPHAQFLVALGNNDDPCGDYHSEVGGTYAAAIASAFAPLVDRNGSAPDFARRFADGGYYRVRLPGGLHAVVLNSVLWSFVFRGSCQHPARGAGAAELRWLDRVLHDGKNVILMHVPPGFDAQSTTVAHRLLAVPFLSRANDRELRAIFARRRASIAFALGAHTHRYDIRVPAGVSMLIASSLSPVYRNNPAFYVLDVEGTELKDVHPVVDDMYRRRWIAEPSFDRMYGTSALTPNALIRLSRRIADDAALRARWIAAYDVWSWRVGDISDHRWQTFRCAQVAFGSRYARCAGTRPRSIAAVVVLAVAVIACVLAVLWIIRLRRGVRDR